MRILEEFWYGNVEPMEYGSFSNEEYKELLRLITKNEEKLQATFSDEQRAVLQIYRLCSGVSDYIRVPAIPEQFPSGSKNDAGGHGRIIT